MKRTILIVEDDENDRLFESLAFEALGLKQSLQFAVDGREALDYLQGNGKFQDRTLHPLPYIVLLDLNLPQVKGLDILQWMRAQPQFAETIVIPVTASSHAEDIRAARELGANDYLVKPISLAGWRAMAWKVETCWLREPVKTTRIWGTLARVPVNC